MLKVVLAAACLTGCATTQEDQIPLTPMEVIPRLPEDTVTTLMHVPGLEERWVSHGLPPVSDCRKMYQLWLPGPEYFKTYCGLPSCFVDDKVPCAWACSHAYVTEDFDIMMYYLPKEPTVKYNEPYSEAHEQIHMWAFCTMHDGDAHHKDPLLWGVLLKDYK